MPPNAGFRRILGPYDVLRLFASRPQSIGCVIPFQEVAGGQISISSADNFVVSGLIDSIFVPTVEVDLVGLIQGTPTTIKTSQIRSLTGPMNYVFPSERVFETVEVRARFLIGGNPIQPVAPNPAQAIFLTAGVFLLLNVSIQPRLI